MSIAVFVHAAAAAPASSTSADDGRPERQQVHEAVAAQRGPAHLEEGFQRIIGFDDASFAPSSSTGSGRR